MSCTNWTLCETMLGKWKMDQNYCHVWLVLIECQLYIQCYMNVDC